ncbi:hypothetical protein P43SY_005188 [Pythium insidiosum]|uniref:FYVE-type domain-containing protein n=1 Tax=Pythium insidiosum TaxID=114742 RepID=A0AAD5QDQ5_PYTIN|nr:hypothetical protein P43SY_005188 [Pythium insidiosum]
MGRPRGSSNPMRPSRLLKPGSSASLSVMHLQLPSLPPWSVSRAREEEMESRARAALGLFGFGCRDGMGATWSRVAPSAFEQLGVVSASGGGSGSGSAAPLALMERVCPLGLNATLWNTMHNGEAITTASVLGESDIESSLEDDGGSGDWSGTSTSAGADAAYLFASKLLQQYLVKVVAVIPGTVEEVIELLVRSDGDDMDAAMQHLVGVKAVASGEIYRRRRKRLRRRHLPIGGASAVPVPRSTLRFSTSGHSLADDSDSSSSSASSGADDDQSTDDGESAPPRTRSAQSLPPPRAAAPRRGVVTKALSLPAGQGSSSSSSSSSGGGPGPGPRPHSQPRPQRRRRRREPSDENQYDALLAETANRGNLSVKWVVGERAGRMFSTRVHYCLLDYECVLVNDWDDAGDGGPMYVRTLQSCYDPLCAPWLDEFGARPADLQPAGFMVREAPRREPGMVEIQFVASVLEKTQLPNLSRRAKLRALVARMARLDELVTSRRLSASLLSHQPLWVRNRDRALCRACDAKFGLSRRRHHCRLCGEVCCAECCPKMDVALPDVGPTSVRVCVHCVRKRRQSGSDYMPPPPPPPPPQPQLTSASASTSASTPRSQRSGGVRLSSSSSSESVASSYGSLSSSVGKSSLLQRFKS